MLIELRPGLLTNKGGHLMLLAAIDALASYDLAVETWVAPYADRARLALLQKPWFYSAGPAAGMMRLAPNRVRRSLGVVVESEIDAVIDLGGYALSDSFGAAKARRAEANVRRWARSGKGIVFLPQAFGPFSEVEVRRSSKRILSLADLVFARDEESLGFARGLVGDQPTLRMAPDFTIAVAGIPSDERQLVGVLAVVPNQKMLTHGSQLGAARYVDLMADAVRYGARKGLHVIGLVHETATDRELLERLAAASGVSIELLDESDPRKLKGLLGSASLVVGSRYHALVSALAQGVPVVALGWSHKYNGLMRDFGCEDQLLDPAIASTSDIQVAVTRCLEPGSRGPLVARILERRARIIADTEAMWCAVRDLLDKRDQRHRR